MTRRIEASPEEVFDAWTNPEVLRRWWAAQPTWDTPEAEVDLRPGGRYRLSMRNPESGEVHTLVGEYKEVQRPDRLAYTWTWESNPKEMQGSEGSLVEVDFREDGNATEVVLTHSGFANEQLRDMHEMGWSGCLANLESRVFVGSARERVGGEATR